MARVNLAAALFQENGSGLNVLTFNPIQVPKSDANQEGLQHRWIEYRYGGLSDWKRTRRFSQPPAPSKFPAKVSSRHRLANFWIAVAVTGCLGLLCIKSTAVSGPSLGVDQRGEYTPCRDTATSDPRFGLAVMLALPSNGSRRKRLRIVIYARYSTAEQDKSSIADQVAFCKRRLAEMGIDGDIEEISDPETSGETLDRPGMNKLRQGLEEARWDLLIAEDSSRLFRSPTHCGELVETAVDEGIRVLCINDFVDTNNEDWPERLRAAQDAHAKANWFTRQRLKRKREALWEMGAAMGKLRPGYRRRPTVQASYGEPAKGPFFDDLDPELQPIVYEAFERVGNGEKPWSVAHWLNTTPLKTCDDAADKRWDERNVISLIASEVYKGIECYGKTKTTRKLRKLKKVARRRRPEDVKRRPMERQRIVPDWLWAKANRAIEGRVRTKDTPQGDDHPLANIPRDSRGPLSNLLVCFCGAKMWAEGRNEGGYKCSGACNGECWNKATALKAITHQAISTATADALLALAGALDGLLQYGQQLDQDQDGWRKREAELLAEERSLSQRCQRVLDSIETGKEPPASLVDRLDQRTRELEDVRTAIAELRATAANRRLSSPEEIRARIDECRSLLLDMEPRAAHLLGQLIDGKIVVVPYQQFGSNKVVLRAHFKLKFVKFIPEELIAALKGTTVAGAESVESVDMVVDLFEPTPVPRHALQAAVLKRKMSLSKVGRALGISKRQAHLAAQLGVQMLEHGMTDAYVRLTEEPQEASRWKRHPKFDDRQIDESVNGECSGAGGDVRSEPGPAGLGTSASGEETDRST